MFKKHRDNLEKLATHLDALPVDYEHFDMRDYNALGGSSEWPNRQSLDIRQRSYDCGTVACAVGHGPAAGIRVYGDQSWSEYAYRVFGMDRFSDAFEYLFGSTWRVYDNTPQGAAERIRTYLKLNGNTPRLWPEKRGGGLSWRL